MSVSTARMPAVPVTPQDWCDWGNYTLDPVPQNTNQQASAGAPDPTLARSPTLTLLSNPVVTAMTGQELDDLVTQLAPARAAQTAQRCYAQRRAHAATPPELACARCSPTPTALCSPWFIYASTGSQTVLAELLEINPHSLGEAIADTHQLLDEHRHTTSPPTTRFTTVAACHGF